METKNKKKVVIIGAGICGLSVATQLTSLGRSAVLIEKSKGVGGRLATRRDSQATYDHGAAFYKESQRHSLLWHQRWQNQKKSKLWFAEGEQQYFCGINGMTALAKDLAEGETIYLGEKVNRVSISNELVTIFCESGNTFTADQIIFTCPLPQSLDILNASEIVYPTYLNNILYGKALVGLFELEPNERKLDLLFENPKNDIFSISNNQQKGISRAPALTVVMSDSWSEKHFERDEAQVLALIHAELIQFLGTDCRSVKSQLKKWRYSQPLSICSEKYLTLENERIFLAGDAFGGASIGGAVSSAEAVFLKLTQNEN